MNFSKNILSESLFLLSEKILTVLISAIIIYFFSTNFEKELFGTYIYYSSIIAILISMSKFGFDSVTSIELSSQNHKTVLSSIFFTRLFVSLVIILFLSIYSFWLPKIDRIIFLTLSSLILFKTVDVFRGRYEFELKNKNLVLIFYIGFLPSAMIKIYYAAINPSFLLLVISLTIESFIVFFILVIVNKKFISYNYFSYDLIKKIILRIWPLSLSSIIVILNAKIDQLMVNNFLDKTELAEFSIGIKLTEYTIIAITALSPIIIGNIIKYKSKNPKSYKILYNRLYKLFFIIGLLIALIIYFFGGDVILLVFGESYVNSLQINSIYCFLICFSFLGIINSIYTRTEFLEKTIILRQFMMIFSNLVLNIILIPSYGIVGAAYATLISMFLNTIIFNQIHPKFKFLRFFY
jgi:O-antigen/teichoic acid export membrane protein